MLATTSGRAKFWAESAEERNGQIHFRFPNGWEYESKVLIAKEPSLFCVEYLGSTITFQLVEDSMGGTDLTLTDEGSAQEHRCEIIAGWVSVLMALKAAVDHNVDLRNHDPGRTWDQGYVGN